MFSDHGCRGRVELGALPEEIESRLVSLPGEWLEFEPESDAVVVRHAQPSSGPDLPVIAGELVQILSLVPPELHREIAGGDFYVHTHDTGQFVRLHVAPGGALHIEWANPDFAAGETHPYRGRVETQLDPVVQRIDGRVCLRATDPEAVAAELQRLADHFEGLYPEGECRFETTDDTLVVGLRALNLDAHLLLGVLEEHALEGSLEGGFTVTAFGREVLPEESLQIVFEGGRTLVRRPLLWSDAAGVAS